jgi:hypothetical protein
MRLASALLATVALALAACGSEKPNTEPEGGLWAFGQAVFAGDERAVWDTLSPRIHTMFAEALDDMHSMYRMVGYLQTSEQGEVRERAGLDQLASFNEPFDLFAWVFNPSAVEQSDRFVTGMRPDTVERLDEDSASILTAAGQHFSLLRDTNGHWRVHEPIATLCQSRIERVTRNLENLEATVALFGTGTDLREEMIRHGVLLPEE